MWLVQHEQRPGPHVQTLQEHRLVAMQALSALAGRAAVCSMCATTVHMPQNPGLLVIVGPCAL